MSGRVATSPGQRKKQRDDVYVASGQMPDWASP